jgi:hypothetical protein
MNEWDRDNLDFIRFSTESDFNAWIDQATNEDIAYALELLNEHKRAILLEMRLLNDPQLVDFNDAKALIERVK